MKNYDVTTHTYNCDTSMRLRVQGFQVVKLKCITGSVEAMLIVEKNGQEVAKAYIGTGSGYNLLFMRTDQLNLNNVISCKAGDRIQVRRIIQRQTRTGAWQAEVYNNPDNSWVAFTPELTTGQNEPWMCSRNLPDVTGLQLLKALSFWYSADWQINKQRQELRLNRLTEVVNGVDKAADWSTRIDTSEDVGWEPFIEPYAQKNYLKWKDSDETKKADDGSTLAIPYGDGLITVNATALNAETTLFELPFAATINSASALGGYGNPPLIRTRAVSGTGENLTINKQSATPRVLLVSLDKTYDVASKRLAADNETLEDVQVRLRPCWFGPRPAMLIEPRTAFTLAFSPVANATGEVCLIDAHYDGLISILRRMRKLTVGMRLQASDVSTLDFGRLIRLQRVNIGGLVLADSFWYLNRIDDYGSDGKAKVILVGC